MSTILQGSQQTGEFNERMHVEREGTAAWLLSPVREVRGQCERPALACVADIDVPDPG